MLEILKNGTKLRNVNLLPHPDLSRQRFDYSVVSLEAIEIFLEMGAGDLPTATRVAAGKYSVPLEVEFGLLSPFALFEVPPSMTLYRDVDRESWTGLREPDEKKPFQALRTSGLFRQRNTNMKKP